jgi:hypothetical protein
MLALVATVLAATALGYAIAWVVWRDARRAAIVTAVTAVLILKLGQIDTILGSLWQVHPAVTLIGAAALVTVVVVAAGRARYAMMAPLTQAELATR